ncbi:MAG: addiction module protein [Candidatus Delongbacteria bacterium]|nr:addiction module protein [Candidatus Delongbacteria bacterium]MCG2760292.1 addiction module protein [Candidatus Delongbacteria bacterium]
MITEELKKETMKLNPIDKVHLVEMILQSLNEIDPEIEKAWVAESETRYGDYKAGKSQTVSFDSIKKRLNK